MSTQRSKRQDFKPSCPVGGTWYACGFGSKFVGCCATDPCANGCSQGSIYPATFDPAYQNTFPDASCGTSANFYTCTNDTSAFWGCCKTDPCGNELECPVGNLVPAFLDQPNQLTAYHASGVATSTSASPTSSSTEPPLSSGHQSHTGAIIGGAVAGGVVILILVCLLVFFVLRAKKSRKKLKEGLEYRQSESFANQQKGPDVEGTPGTMSLPVYSSPKPGVYGHAHSHSQSSNTYHPSSPEPQELAGSPLLSPNQWNTNAPRPLSELFAEAGPPPSELETPMPSPYASGTPRSPPSAADDQPQWTGHEWQRGVGYTH